MQVIARLVGGGVVVSWLGHSFLITSSISLASWNEAGGPGSIREFRGAQALVITQTFQVHRDVEKLLAALRSLKKEQAESQPQTAEAEVQDDETYYVVVYRLPAAWRYRAAMGGGASAASLSPPANPQPAADKPAKEEPKVPKTVQPQMVIGGMGMGGMSVVHTSITAEELAKAFPAVIEPDSWDVEGGEGAIRAVDHKLLVRQTRPVHRQIEQLLQEMR